MHTEMVSARRVRIFFLEGRSNKNIYVNVRNKVGVVSKIVGSTNFI